MLLILWLKLNLLQSSQFLQTSKTIEIFGLGCVLQNFVQIVSQYLVNLQTF